MFHKVALTAGRCLEIDPKKRVPVKDLCEQTKALATALNIDLESPVDGVEKQLLSSSTVLDNLGGNCHGLTFLRCYLIFKILV